MFGIIREHMNASFHFLKHCITKNVMPMFMQYRIQLSLYFQEVDYNLIVFD